MLEGTPPSMPSIAPPARGWSISAAGTCRSITGRRSKSTTRCVATPACSTSRTCASSTCTATAEARARASCATRSPTTSTSCATPGKALYSCLLRDDGGVLDDLIVYFLREDWFRLVVNAGTADKDVAWLARSPRSARRGCELVPRARSRDDRRAGSAGPREGLAGVARQRSGERQSLEPFNAVSVATAFGDLFIARTGYTGEDGFEIMLPRRAAPALWQALRRCGRRGLRPRRARHPAPGSRNESLWAGHGRGGRSPLESGLAWTVDLTAPRDFVGKPALLARRIRRAASPGSCCRTRAACCAPISASHCARRRRSHQRHVFADAAAGRSRWPGCPAAVAPGDTVRVDIRGKPLRRPRRQAAVRASRQGLIVCVTSMRQARTDSPTYGMEHPMNVPPSLKYTDDPRMGAQRKLTAP